MVSILLWILKIAGFLLLSVLGILLLLLFLVLAVPIRYRVQASFHQRLLAEARISWLFRFLSISVAYEEELTYSVRILGIRLRSSEAKDASEEEMEETKAPEPEPETESIGEPADLKPPRPIHEPVSPQTEGLDKQTEFQKSALERPQPDQEPSGPWRGKRLRSFFQRIEKKVKALSEKRQRLVAFWEKEENQKTFGLVFGQVKRLLLHLLPTGVSADVILGFEDPARTGQILSYLSIPQAFYGDQIRITPVFDRDIKEGDVTVKGRIRLGTIAACLIRVFLDRNFRVLLKKWRTYGGQ